MAIEQKSAYARSTGDAAARGDIRQKLVAAPINQSCINRRCASNRRLLLAGEKQRYAQAIGTAAVASSGGGGAAGRALIPMCRLKVEKHPPQQYATTTHSINIMAIFMARASYHKQCVFTFRLVASARIDFRVNSCRKLFDDALGVYKTLCMSYHIS